MFYTIARFLCFLACKFFFRLKIYGRENFPAQGPLIVAPNHASFLDPVIVGVGAPVKLHYLARETLFKFWLFGKILRSVNAIPLKREFGDIGVFRNSLAKLSQKKALLIFPEGTRSKDDSLQKPKHGIGFLAAFSGADVLPCYVKGSAEALPRNSSFPKFRPVSVCFGKVLKFDKNSSADKKERYVYIAQEVMRAIDELKRNAD